MTKQEIKTFRQRVSAFIDRRRLHDAISEIKEMAHKRMAWEVEERIKNTEQNYAYMLKYFTQGVEDPERQGVYNGIIDEIYSALDALISFIELADSPTLYYNNIRYNRLHPRSQSLGQLIRKYQDLADKLSIFTMVMNNNQENQKSDRQEMENIQNDIFVRIWTTPQLSSEDAAVLQELIANPMVKDEMKQHVVSAITLGELQQSDWRKLSLLMSTYLSYDNIKVTSAALVGMLLGLWKYSKRPLNRKLQDLLMSVKDKPTWTNDLQTAFIELIRARDTERINQKMRDEVIPKMERIRPDMMDKINNANIDPEDPMSLQENPEWQEMLEKSGIADQLKELTEIQLEGGDVMMSTFSHLKQYPFFQNISNWFLPFDSSHTSIAQIVNELDVVGDMMENARFLCDSDKYSFMMAINSVPSNQRDLMVQQMRSQSEGLYEAMTNLNSGTSTDARRKAVNSYMQNIYRFFKLFYRKDEFFDPFAYSLNLISVPALSDDFNDIDLLQVVAEFYFKLRYMKEALDVYMHLEQLIPGDASRCQKIGYCYERLGNYKKAIEYYQRAELLESESIWTIKRLAASYRQLGDKEMALKYYERLSTLQPDNIGAAMLYGQSLMENEDYQEALHEFYRIEFMDEKSSKVWRPLAWTLFMLGKYEDAYKYYERIINDNPSDNDYLNIGHVHLAMGDVNSAVNSYNKAISAHNDDKEWYAQAMLDDTPSLTRAGIDPTLIPLVVDASLYSKA